MTVSLFEACKQNDVNRVEQLINEKCNLNELDKQGRSVLHYCSNHANVDCANLILNDATMKATILNLQDYEGCSALHLACINGNEVMVKYLCEQGANVQLLDHESRSCIHWITVCRQLHLFDILIQYKAPIHTPDIHGAFPIHYAAQLTTSKENTDSNKDLAILQQFIDHKVDIDCTDEQNRTPFMWAASAGAIEELRLLYKYGANQLLVDKNSLTALHCAAHRGHRSCVQMLVEHCRCPIDGEDTNGFTALFYAIIHNHASICKLLLNLKANPNHKDRRGRTPSHHAMSNTNLDCLKYLVEHNANLWLKSKRGDYPIHEAVNHVSTNKVHKKSAMIRYVYRLYPNKINVQNDEHRTVLHLAAGLGDIDMCQLLIECGAKVNSFAHNLAGDYLTPYDLARHHHQDKCAEFLLHKHAGQYGHVLANIYARRIQKCYRQYRIQKSTSIDQNPKSSPKIMQPRRSLAASMHSKHSTLKELKPSFYRKSFDEHFKTNAAQTKTANISKENNDTHTEERRRNFIKSKTTATSINESDESKSASANTIIIHSSNSVATYNRLYDRRKIIVEELHKLRQARNHNHYIVINRSLYKILIENAFNPQHRCVDDIEKYLETLIISYDQELEAIRKRTSSLPPKQNRRTSIM